MDAKLARSISPEPIASTQDKKENPPPIPRASLNRCNREGADESFAGKTNENGCKFGKAGEIPEQLEVVFKSFSKTDAWVDDACFCGDADLSCS